MNLAGTGWFSAFAFRSFRFQWSSDLAMSWAMEMETLILGWFVLISTDSPLLTSVLAALHFGGTLLCPFSGVVADRISRRTLLIALRLSYAVLAAAIMLLGVSDMLQTWHLFLIAGLSGLLRPSDLVVRTALIADIVPPAALRNAVAYARTTLDIARILGAMLGAALFAQFGIGLAYGAVVGLYLASALLTGGIALRFVPAGEAVHPLQDLRSGFRYVRSDAAIVAIMLLALLINLVAFPISNGLLPVIARDLFAMDESGLAALVIAFACGALIGSVAVAVAVRVRRTGATMLVCILLWHASVLALGFVESVWLGLLTIAFIGLAHSGSVVLMSLLLLRVCEPRYRGRVFGVRMLAIYALPVGLVIAGFLIEQVGITATFALYGLIGLVLALAIGFGFRNLAAL